MSEMTNTELAVLGLIAECPKHGYQIEQDIEARDMRQWTEIGFSSIYYVLNKLQTAGWLSSRIADGVDERGGGRDSAHRSARGPARRVYQVTEAGQAALHEAVLSRLAHPNPRGSDFDLALANLPVLDPAEARAALEAYQAELSEQLAQMRRRWEMSRASNAEGGGHIPPNVEGMFSRSAALMEAELAWVSDFLKTL